MRRHAWLAILSALAGACGGSPTAPSNDAASRNVLGRTVSATDGRAAAGVSVQAGRERATSDVDGMFEIAIERGAGAPAVLASATTVERRTTIAPADRRLTLSLIPASFDLDAFDQMARTANSRLQRWTARPRLVVIATVMNYRSSADEAFAATAEQLTDDEVNTLVTHLTEGLALLTGRAFTTFASIEVERPAQGVRVPSMRAGAIVVGRYDGVTTFAATVGYGRWAEQADGTVTAGAMFLDRDFDRDDSRRRLLRIHELGHALGYLHVTSRTSVMNPSIGPEPTEFDRLAATIAFERNPGNRAPDTDPDASPSRSPFSLTLGRRSRWAAPVFCGPASQR